MHSGTSETFGPRPSAASYVVIVEEKTRNRWIWHVSLIHPAGSDLMQARIIGQNIAFQHQPRTAGRWVGRRDVYRLGEDSWLTAYKASSWLGGTWHFRVSIAHYVGSTG